MTLSEDAARRAEGDRQQAEGQGPDQPAEDGRVDPRLGQQAGVDGAGRDPGDPARPASAGAARFGQLRHERPERPLPPDHQPEQPAQEAGRPERAGGDHPQREADAAAVGRRAVRQQPLQAAGARFVEPPAEVAHRHDQGQAGPFPREPARQAGRLLGPFGDRGRARSCSCTSAACPRRSRWSCTSRSSSAGSRSWATPTRSSRPRRCWSARTKRSGTSSKR